MKSFVLIFSVLIFSQLSSILAQTNGFCNLVWNDEFNGPNLDTSKWQIEQNCKGGGNNELQCYTARSQNLFIEDGKLVLRAIKERYTGTQQGCTETEGCTDTKEFTSGRVNTRPGDSGSWTYGRFETRAKLVSGSHLWPAIWMMPKDYSYGGWAASGEIDIMEARGNKPKELSGTLHHGAEWPRNIWTSSGDKIYNDLDLSEDYHVYTVEWTPDQMKWYIDGWNFNTLNLRRWWNATATNSPYTAQGQPWDRRFHFILNLAIGGGYFNGYPALTDADVRAWKVPEMRVDYVRVWSSGGDCTRNPFATSANPTSANPTSANPTSANPPSTPSGDLCGDIFTTCATFCSPTKATQCDCDPKTGVKTVVCADGNGNDLNAGEDGSSIPGSDRTWMEKNGAILFGAIAGVVVLAAIAVIGVAIYMKKKRQFDIAQPSPTQSVTIFPGSP